MVTWMVDHFGNKDLKDKYLPGLVSFDTPASYCLTEPDSGSDAQAMKTTAVD